MLSEDTHRMITYKEFYNVQTMSYFMNGHIDAYAYLCMYEFWECV